MTDRQAEPGPQAASDGPNAGAGGPLDLIKSVLDRVGWVAVAVSGVSLVTIIVIFGWQVYGRYVLNATPTWTEQLGLLLVVYISFLSAAVGVHEGTHLSVTLITDALPARLRRWVHTLADLVMLGFGATLAIFGWSLTKFMWTTNIPLINIPEAWRILPVVIGGWMIVGFSVSRIVRRVLLGEDDDPHGEAEIDAEVAAAATKSARS